jgi:hypothetical protein
MSPSIRRSGLLTAALASLLGLLVCMGPGQASATELCEAQEEVCEEGFYEAGTEISASSSNAEFPNNIGTIKCGSSTMKVETTAAAGEPLEAFVSNMAFSSCHLKETSCTVEALSLPYLAEIDETATDSGTFTLLEYMEEGPTIQFKCSFFISCTVRSESLTSSMEGGEPATIEAIEDGFTTHEGTFCPKTAKFSATYSVESPTALHLVPTPTKLCTTTGDPNNECNITYTGSIKSELVSSAAKFETPLGSISCAESKFIGENFTGGGVGKLDGIEYKSVGICSSEINSPLNPGVRVKMEYQPYNVAEFEFLSETQTNKASFTVGLGIPVELALTIEVTPAVQCRYLWRRNGWVVVAYAPMKIKSNWLWTRVGTNAECPATVKLEAELSVKRSNGGNLWITK